MPAAAVAFEIEPEIVVRRFQVADLTRHGGWLLPRLLTAYPHLSEQRAAGWLRSILNSNEHLFLSIDCGVALAQIMGEHTLSPKPVVWERFVWAQDKADARMVARVAHFYDEISRWSKGQGSEVIIVEENSDVPHDLVKERLGRVFTRQQLFARL